MGDELADLQERLWAERTVGSERRVLLVLQGMDTSGKGGVLRHTIGLVDPQGVRITSFKAPTDEERAHDFLWRIERGLPAAGYIGVFDRSHYEDVLIAKVRGFAEPDEIERRYGAINEFEARLVGRGLLDHQVHAPHQRRRAEGAAARSGSANPEKHWKYNPGDLDERAFWPAYREAYEIALERTSTAGRPVARRPVRQEVVPQPRRRPAAPRHAARARPAVAEGRLRRRGRDRAARRGDAGPVISTGLPARHRHALRHPAARGRQPARGRRGRRPRHLRLQVPRRRPGREGARRRGDRQRPRDPARPAHPAPRRARPRPRARPLRGRRGGAGPAQRQRRRQPRHRLPARLVRRRRPGEHRRRRGRAASSGSTPSPPTSTARGATPTSWSGTATSG